MRFSETLMTVAIYGRTCTGKTSIAKILGVKMNYAVRHCGELVLELASLKNIAPGKLSGEDHARIDDTTRELARGDEDLIIEGNFLDAVLGNVAHCILIELTCDDAVREARYVERTVALPFSERDVGDCRLRQRLYPGTEWRLPDLQVNTANKTPAAVAEGVARWIRKCKNLM